MTLYDGHFQNQTLADFKYAWDHCPVGKFFNIQVSVSLQTTQHCLLHKNWTENIFISKIIRFFTGYWTSTVLQQTIVKKGITNILFVILLLYGNHLGKSKRWFLSCKSQADTSADTAWTWQQGSCLTAITLKTVPFESVDV